MKHILLSRTDRIGDVVLTTATFEPLHRKFPDAQISLLVRPEIVPLLENDPCVQPLRCPPGRGAKGLCVRRILSWCRAIRHIRADAAVFLHPDNDLQIAAALAGVPRRIGYRRQTGRLALNESIPYRRHLGEKHEAICNFDLLERMGCSPPRELRPRLFLGRNDAPPAETPFAVLHPAAFGSKPRWPASHFAELAAAIHRTFGWRIVLVGGDPSPDLADLLAKGPLPPGCWTDRGGRDTLLETAHLLGRARVVVSRDSGPAHLAAALGTPLVCLMGQCDPIHSPTRWAPIGTSVRTLVSDLAQEKGETRQARWRRCFAAISPTQVMNSINELLGESSYRRLNP